MSLFSGRNVMRLFGKRRNQLARVDNTDELVVQLIEMHDAGALIDVVEIDQAVVTVAKKFFYFDMPE